MNPVELLLQAASVKLVREYWELGMPWAIGGEKFAPATVDAALDVAGLDGRITALAPLVMADA